MSAIIFPSFLKEGILMSLADNLKRIRKEKHISQEELAEEFGFSLRTVKRAMKSLQDEGLLVRNGNRRSGSWIIVQ